MAEPKQRRTSRSELLARPVCLKATGDLRCFHRHAVLLLFNAIRRLLTPRLSSPNDSLRDRLADGRDGQFARHGPTDGANIDHT